MVSQNLYENSGNLIMRGTNEHKRASKKARKIIQRIIQKV
jgi:hypothetical protein